MLIAIEIFHSENRNMSSEDTCKVWLAIQTVSTPDPYRNDLEHTLMLFKNKKQLEELEEERDACETFMSVDSRELTIKKDQRVLYIVFHYHDNYSDNIRVFETQKEARDYYTSEIVTMDEYYLDDAEGYSIKMQKFPGGGYMTTLYDEEDSYPDKGSRWVMTKLEFPSCASAAVSGGARKVRSRGAKKTRKARNAARKMRS